MAINAQQLLGSLSNPVLAQNEQVMQDYFEKSIKRDYNMYYYSYNVFHHMWCTNFSF